MPEVPVATLPTPDRRADTQVDRMRHFVNLTRDQFAPTRVHTMVEERWD